MLKKLKKIKNSIFQSGHGNLAFFKSKNITVNNIQALDQLSEYIKKGQLNNATELIHQMNKFLSTNHPGAPYYKYEFSINDQGQQVISHVPAFPGAEKLMPLKGSMKFRLPDTYKKFKSLSDLLNYSYGMQQTLELDIESFKTWIGDTVLEEHSNKDGQVLKLRMTPKKFPPPSPMKLYTMDNSWSIDYLLIGVKEINNNKIVFDNSQQSNAPFGVMFTVDLDSKIVGFNIRINDSALHSVKHILKFKEMVLISQKSSKPSLGLKLLEQDSDVIVGQQWQFSEKDSVDTQIFVNFLRKLYMIEQHFGINFIIPERAIQEDEIILTERMFRAIQGEHLQSDFIDEHFEFRLYNDSDIQRLFMYDENNPEGFSVNLDLINSESFMLFGIKFKEVEHTVHFENIKLENPSRLRKKNNMRDSDEPLKIRILPMDKTTSVINEIIKISAIQ